MVRDTVDPPARPRGSGCSSTPSTSSTATAPTATTRSRCCARPPRPAPRWSRCATPTAACCPTGSPTSSHDVVDDHRRPRSASTATTTPAARSPTRWPPSTPGATPRAGHAQRLRRAHRQRRPGHRRRQPRAQARTGRCCPPGVLREATRIAHAVAEVTNVPPASRQPYVGTSAFAHKAGLHASAIKVDPNLYQHIDPRGVGNDMRLLVSDMAGRASHRAQGPRAGLRPVRATRDAGHPGHRPGQGAGVARLHLRGGRRVLRAAARRGGRGRAARRTSTSSPGG